MTWQPIDTCPKTLDKQYLLGCAGWGAVLAEWNATGNYWVEHLGGEYYGVVIPFDPTHWMEVDEVPGVFKPTSSASRRSLIK